MIDWTIAKQVFSVTFGAGCGIAAFVLAIVIVLFVKALLDLIILRLTVAIEKIRKENERAASKPQTGCIISRNDCF